MRFNLRMIDLRATDLLFTDKIRSGEALLPIAEVVMNLTFDIAGLVVVQQRRAWGTRFL